MESVTKRREIFKEKNWTVLVVDERSRIDVGHLNCPKTIIDGQGDTNGEGPVTYTFLYGDKCYYCHEKFPDFIRNMMIFTRWTLGIDFVQE